MAAPLKLCKDCKWFVITTWGHGDFTCDNPVTHTMSLVWGDTYKRRASDSRADSTLCGEKARYFVPR